MARSKRKRANVKLPRDREESLKREVRDDLEHVIFAIGDSDMDDDTKEELIEILSDVEDLTVALINRVRIPSKGLSYPWEDITLN
jgi:hypothetical protein